MGDHWEISRWQARLGNWEITFEVACAKKETGKHILLDFYCKCLLWEIKIKKLKNRIGCIDPLKK